MSTEQHGFWESPVTAEMVASSGSRKTELQADRGYLYWIEQLPKEAGRQVLCCLDASGNKSVVTPPGFSVRSRVHEYGGGAYLVDQGVIFFVNDKDQCVYQQVTGKTPVKITEAAQKARAHRYADFCVSKDHQYLFAVRERHVENHVVHNELVCIHLNNRCDITVIATGYDFYSNPCFSPDEKKLAWLCWSHPQMPWDGAELWVASVDEEKKISNAQQVVGSDRESLYQPAWSPAGELYVVSDRTGWWNIYHVQENQLISVCDQQAEFGTTQWVFGTRCYDFLDDGRIVAIATIHAEQQLGVISGGQFVAFDINENVLCPYLAVIKNCIFYLGGSGVSTTQLMQYDILTSKILPCFKKTNLVSEDYLSVADPISFENEEGEIVHSFYYAPKNPSYALINVLPPLIVFCHGGPIAATTPDLNWKIQFWTSRGFAVVDVNYSGSAGFGKAYRDRLKNEWGVRDVRDCVQAARFLVQQKKVDPKKLFIRGSSAGGLTVLSALTFYDDFTAGASYYGVSNLMGLLDDTHKFEAKTLDVLVGEYPKEKQRYYDRSPVNFADQLTSPVIFFQGLEDHVVPKEQAELMIQAMKNNGVAYEYVTFKKEGHGFRDAVTIKKAITAELDFYRKNCAF